ncbi:MAG: hypothetical protein KDA97_01010 [Acidimicrobiales bacterium]|nr:hypothetical protein [Acidimicrobiales bacterium]
MTPFSREADERTRLILTQVAADLIRESERVAKRHRASQVSEDYVQVAADTLQLRVTSGWTDVFLAAGSVLLGVAMGLTASFYQDDWTGISGLAIAVAVGIGAAGLILFVTGCTRKVLE